MRKLVFIILLTITGQLSAQSDLPLLSLRMADTLHKPRLIAINTSGAVFYTGATLGLATIWYAGYERSGFHLFNDLGEWNDMDKVGHFTAAMIETNWAFRCELWAGLERRKAMWTAIGIGSLFQATIEILDGFSTKWGFSIPDMAMNTAGVAVFGLQEHFWQEQRMIMKFSSYRKPYSSVQYTSMDGASSISPRERATDLFGESWQAIFLKDYNAQTLWASVNIKSFMKNKSSKLPGWLNIAVGYGSQNMFGGFKNEWSDEDVIYSFPNDLFPRYRQYYLSFDIDLTRIKTKSPFVKTLLGILNCVKIPSPTLEYNTLGQLKFHPLFF